MTPGTQSPVRKALQCPGQGWGVGSSISHPWVQHRAGFWKEKCGCNPSKAPWCPQGGLSSPESLNPCKDTLSTPTPSSPLSFGGQVAPLVIPVLLRGSKNEGETSPGSCARAGAAPALLGQTSPCPAGTDIHPHVLLGQTDTPMSFWDRQTSPCPAPSGSCWRRCQGCLHLHTDLQ